MIVDARALDNDAKLHASICIIGGGAAGITLALELGKYFKDVILLESGGFELETATQELYKGSVLGQGITDVDTSRLRYLGGSTNHWGGQCAPLDAVSFEKIPGRPYSGWPFAIDELATFYGRAYRYCELGVYRDKSKFVEESVPKANQIFDNPELDLAEFRYSPPTRFGERYRSDLTSSNHINTYLNANVVDFSISDNGNTVNAVEVRTLSGIRFKVLSTAFILCCGGIENPRILLNSSHFFPTGIGNEYDLVGRFFMDHLSTGAGTIIPTNGFFSIGFFDISVDETTNVRVVLKNSDAIVRSIGREGCSLLMYPEFAESAAVWKTQNSSAFTAFRELVQDAKRGRIPAQLKERGCVALDDPGSIAAALYYRWTESWRNKGALKGIFVRMEGEQSPNPSSRVVLTEEVDAFGLRRVGLDWRITDADYDNLYKSALALARGVGAAGFGRMVLDIRPKGDLSEIATAWHHIGTTRMHDDRRQGVVDRNCQVHGIANLYIAGSSVFPTGGRVNPTLTIVALAIRLADYLKLKVKNA